MESALGFILSTVSGARLPARRPARCCANVASVPSSSPAFWSHNLWILVALKSERGACQGSAQYEEHFCTVSSYTSV